MAISITPDAELGGYVATDTVTGVTSQGDTEQEARAALAEAVELHHQDDVG